MAWISAGGSRVSTPSVTASRNTRGQRSPTAALEACRRRRQSGLSADRRPIATRTELQAGVNHKARVCPRRGCVPLFKTGHRNDEEGPALTAEKGSDNAESSSPQPG